MERNDSYINSFSIFVLSKQPLPYARAPGLSVAIIILLSGDVERGLSGAVIRRRGSSFMGQRGTRIELKKRPKTVNAEQGRKFFIQTKK